MTEEETFDSFEDNETTTSTLTDEAFKAQVITSFKAIKGVGEAVAEKLFDAKFYTVADIGACPVGEFIERMNVSKASAEKITSNARAIADVGAPQNLLERLEKDDVEKEYLSTGSKSVDVLLGGGYSVGLITELYALPGAGKSQSCFTATVMATAPKEDGGLDGHVLYIDTEGTFSAKRIKQITESRGYDLATVGERIHIMTPRTSSEQVLMMDEAKKLAQQVPIRLIVIDSLIGHFRAEYVGRGTLAERQGVLGKYLGDLQTFAYNNKAVAIVVSQASATPDGFGYGIQYQATGGNVVHHRTAYRLLIKKGKEPNRVFRLDKSPCEPNGEAIAVVDERGVADKA